MLHVAALMNANYDEGHVAALHSMACAITELTHTVLGQLLAVSLCFCHIEGSGGGNLECDVVGTCV